MTTVVPGAPASAAEPTREPARRRARTAAAQVPAAAQEQQLGVPAGPTTLTVKLSGASMESLARAARLSEVNLTDTVNRAVQLYDFVVAALAENRHNALILVRDGHPERVHLNG